MQQNIICRAQKEALATTVVNVREQAEPLSGGKVRPVCFWPIAVDGYNDWTSWSRCWIDWSTSLEYADG